MSELASDNFAALSAAAQACQRCATMQGRRAVLSTANGSLQAQVMFVAEAPGRLGADRSGIPLHDDQAGRNFEALLTSIGWRREQVYITNAVLCNPRDAAGNNRRPSQQELANCASYLREQLELVQPACVVSLGAVALAALGQLEAHGLRLREVVAQAIPWHSRWLLPLYHPGARAMIRRPMREQQRDYASLNDFCSRLLKASSNVAGTGAE